MTIVNRRHFNRPFQIHLINTFPLFYATELDLDFLERRQNASSTIDKQEQEQSQTPIEISPESIDRVKVILLGAPAVGKTSIIQVWNYHFYISH